ncbi:MAG: glycosyltransferase family 4 protein [Candidatus Muirbacterium halophilum]|nr:glycosyltransferase family 4 protein [Candidatus Muirbacterium halophilum]MCK9477230.1 glycosyltransferase family 4 protein [Candidatus Muirbacterium halophilum]
MLEKRIKVAHIITRLIIGGAQENTLYTLESLQNDKQFDAYLISGETLGPEGKLYQTDEFKIKKLIVCPFLTREIEPFNDIRALIFLIKLFKKEKFDIVHTHSSKAGVIGRIAAFISGIPIIIHTIHGLPFHSGENFLRNFIFIKLEKLCAYISNKIISVCDTMTLKFLKAGIGKKNQFITVYSGMNIKRYSPVMNEETRKDERNKLGIFDKDIVFIKVARLFELKGHEYIIKAAEKLKEEYSNIKFIFVGDGILKEQLLKEIKLKNLEKYFIFTGLVSPEKVPFYIELSDCVIHTSLREGLARVIPQGFLMGKPVISWDVDGAWELIKNKETGYLVKEKDEEELLKVIKEVINNKDLALKMALNGQKLCQKLYSHELMGEKIKKLYKNSIEKV